MNGLKGLIENGNPAYKSMKKVGREVGTGNESKSDIGIKKKKKEEVFEDIKLRRN